MCWCRGRGGGGAGQGGDVRQAQAWHQLKYLQPLPGIYTIYTIYTIYVSTYLLCADEAAPAAPQQLRVPGAGAGSALRPRQGRPRHGVPAPGLPGPGARGAAGGNQETSSLF